ncbi:uncharacterized protein LOC122081556 [Macadamia integrifolia]|uniref:uncharacterized protein LOC122081556 n=1 Tax=Macadamia integrifolia TaxID=60698 RepID=UPI001C4FDF0B|nr:uncharacterized protein LOC122081556 [Macadamia integrifolia]
MGNSEFGIVSEEGEKVGNGDGGGYWWGIASSTQLAAAVASYRKGYGGDSCFMPFKAFVVASLFVGAGATAVFGLLRVSGIREVKDLKKVGANIRSGLGVPPRQS